MNANLVNTNNWAVIRQKAAGVAVSGQMSETLARALAESFALERLGTIDEFCDDDDFDEPLTPDDFWDAIGSHGIHLVRCVAPGHYRGE